MVKSGKSGGPVSMTGYAQRRGQGLGFDWVWDIRSVNGRGLDIRLRVPDWIDGLESTVRAEAARAVQRGNVTLSLRLQRAAGEAALRLNRDALEGVLTALADVGKAAHAAGLALAPVSGADILALRGVADQGQEPDDAAALTALLLTDLKIAVAEHGAMRAAEGRSLAAILTGQIDRVAALTEAAAAAAGARRPAVQKALTDNLARVMADAAGADPDRVAQELAMLAVKADVTEELDRLRAHVMAARALMTDEGAVGRKFDFLMQEFMREANTLCSKSGDRDLTRIGLDLKTVIDQMREQVQNVE